MTYSIIFNPKGTIDELFRTPPKTTANGCYV